MDIFVGVIVGLLVLMVLVTAHEFGHFIAARRNGVRVLEFGICFPPRAIAWIKDPKTGKWRRLPRSEWEKDKVTKVVVSKEDTKKLAQKGMIFSINWLPIGGFCQMDGESAVDERAGTFGKASFWAKTKILFAGVAMNWLVAFLIFTVLAWTGMPRLLMNGQFTVGSDTSMEAVPVAITSVLEGSPADEAGLQAGDYVVAINGVEVHHDGEIREINAQNAGKTVTYTINRPAQTCECLEEEECDCTEDIPEQTFDTEVTLNPADAKYQLGVTMEYVQNLSYSTWSAPIVGVGLTLQLTGETFKGVGEMIGSLVSGAARLFSPDEAVRESGQEALAEVRNSVSGPVGIIGDLFPSVTAEGPTYLASLTAVISLSLACMNVLPIPALDGGRWLLIAIYKVRKKKLTKEVEEKVVSRAMMVLLVLFLIVTILDIVRIVQYNGA